MVWDIVIEIIHALYGLYVCADWMVWNVHTMTEMCVLMLYA